ncbi:CsiV family protein [Eionea flava]
MNHLRYLSCLLIAILSISSTKVTAQNAGRWYQVEVLIFKRNTLDSGTHAQQEIWPTTIALEYPDKYRFIQNALPRSTHQLGGYNYTLRKSEQFEVLFHKAWNQQMWGENRSTPLIIQAGERHGEHWELEGSINIHIGRFLHFTTNLWLSEFIYGDTLNNEYSDWPVLPLLGKPNVPSSSNKEISNTPFSASQVQVSRIVKFTERRSMRSKETHYLDHPEMGIMVRMLPIKR